MATILVIEDQLDTGALYRAILESAGYDVLRAISADKGIELAHELQPDLIVMDLLLPGMNGWEATSILKTDPQTEHIPIIAVTASTDAAARARASEAGCNDFIGKPFKPQDLLDIIEGFVG